MYSSSARFPLELIVRSAGRQLARCVVRPGRYHLGHHAANEVEIDEDSISGKHARLIVISEDELYLEDLGSANGTYVDGVPVEGTARVHFTSLVQLGNAMVEFQRAGLPAVVFEAMPPGFLHPRRYTPGELLTRGSTSLITAAHDQGLDRGVALRTMQPACQRSAATVLRFLREAQITAQLQHPNIPPIHDLRLNEDGQLHYTTRTLEGETLASVLERLQAGEAAALERWSLPALLTLWQKAADALAFAHARGVVHGALRPENLIAGAYGEVFVVGWSFAALLPWEERRAAEAPQVRAPGPAVAGGLSAYSAPELLPGSGSFDERADLYALGAVLYALLAWQPPFPEGEEGPLARRIAAGGPIPPPLQPPRESLRHGTEAQRGALGRLALGAMAARPEERPASVRLLQEQVQAALWPPASPAKQRGRPAA